MGPICRFETKEALEAGLKEWQERLFLQDWNIDIVRVPQSSIPGSWGETILHFENHVAQIQMLDQMPLSNMERYCEERILVHELLHLRYNLLENTESYEGKYLDEIQHSDLEKLAKSLIMAKYQVPFSWFKNF